MQQLRFKDLAKLFEELKKKYTIEEIMEMPIYIGDDDELNGVHTAWFCEEINKDKEDPINILINRDVNNKPLKDKAILIS